MVRPYNQSNKTSIISFAKNLESKSLREIIDVSNVYQNTGKGNFGQLVEKYYFGYENNSLAEPDFTEVGMELKCAPLKQLKNGHFVAKERLVLGIIDYHTIVEQDFFNSDYWKKNASLLLIFYLYEQGIDALDFIIKLVDEWSYNSIDLEIIKQDWATIKQKVLEGKAHELSEGDTYYLGACTKGANANSVRSQPYSEFPAKQRAYSLKQGYVNHIIATLAEGKTNYGRILSQHDIVAHKTIEDVVLEKFLPYLNLSIQEITSNLNLNLNEKAKGFYASLTKAILGIELNQEIEEFEKAGIKLKTVRLKENNLPKEDISFPAFEFTSVLEEEWEGSKIKELIDCKFLFVFFQYINDELILKKIKFWNMPSSDMLEMEKIYNNTKELISQGNLVREITEKGIRKTNFPSKKFSNVGHVRPHATNRFDVFPLPVKDKLTGLIEYMKHSFWLNNSYIRDEIYLK